jgi:hypothetical protein
MLLSVSACITLGNINIKVKRVERGDMDFSNRNVQQAAPAAQPTSTGGGRKGKNKDSKWYRLGTAAIVGAVIILVVALVAVLSFANPKSENEYVYEDKLQAVFLNTGQVYFGNIDTLNNKHIVLKNIYYLQTSNAGGQANANANANVSLVKLGCELHEPYDVMVINRDQVTFWENLQDNGQVAKAVDTFKKQNPNGQKCADQSSAASTNSSNATQNAGNSNTSTNTNNAGANNSNTNTGNNNTNTNP